MTTKINLVPSQPPLGLFSSSSSSSSSSGNRPWERGSGSSSQNQNIYTGSSDDQTFNRWVNNRASRRAREGDRDHRNRRAAEEYYREQYRCMYQDCW